MNQITCTIFLLFLLNFISGKEMIASRRGNVHDVMNNTPRRFNSLRPNRRRFNSPNRRFNSLRGISGLLEHPGSLGKDNLTVPYDCTSMHRYCDGTVSLNYQCSCQEDCYINGDCCWGAPVPNGIFNEVSNDESLLESCSEIWTSEFDSELAIMVKKCPPGWKQLDDIRKYCEGKEQNNVDDILLKIPVTGRQTNITYQNLFCAFCNGEQDLVPWKLQTQCLNGTAEVCLSSPDIKHVTQNGKKEPILNIPNELVIQKCEKGYISSCPDQWLKTPGNPIKKSMIQRTCLSFVAPVYERKRKGKRIKYKNKFCAFCNGVAARNLHCINYEISYDKDHKPNIIIGNGGESGQSGNVRPKSFSLLIDIDFIHGGLIVGTTRRCEPMHIYDAVNKICRRVFCGKKFVLKNGDCVPSTKDLQVKNISVPNQSTLNNVQNCQVIHFLLSHEFTKEENGSIFIIKTGMRLSENEYEFDGDNTTIKICAADIETYINIFGKVHSYLSIAGTSISILSLLLKIVLYFVIPEPRNIPSTMVILLSASLLVAQLLFLVGIYGIELRTLCTAIGLTMHYAFLASFFWMNALAFDIWKTFSANRPGRHFAKGKQLAYYCLYAYGLPLLIILVAILFQWIFPFTLLNPQYGFQMCWICNRIALLVFFALPLAILLLANIIFFITTSIKIALTARSSQMALENMRRKDRVRLILYVKLAFVMGLTWIFGFVAAFARSDILWYLFIIFNSSQGLFVLLAFSRFRRSAFAKIKIIKTSSKSSSQNGKKALCQVTNSTSVSHSLTRV